MAMLLRTSTLVVSIDLNAGAGSGQPTLDLARKVHRPLTQLLAEFDVPATWCVGAAGDWNAAAQLVDEEGAHELAILGGEAWTKVSAGRERFVAELHKQFQAAQRAGRQPSSLALTQGDIAAYADLAQKAGITAVRTAIPVAPVASVLAGLFGRLWGSALDGERAYQPAAVRFGVWDLKPSAQWPYPAHPAEQRFPANALRRSLDGAIAEQSVFHLALDATSIATSGESALRGLRKFFAHADRRRRQTRLAIDTMQHLAARLSSPRVAVGARSILRRAA